MAARSHLPRPCDGVRVLLVDAASGTRAELREVLEAAGCEIVGESHDGLEASRLAGALEPQIAVLDLDMPPLGGMSAGSLIHKIRPATRLIAVGSSGDRLFVAAAHGAGFNGYVVRDRTRGCLAEAMQAVLGGGVYPSPSTVKAGS